MEVPQRGYSKLEEALEIKSLRRIISAYLNYSDAAEEDVRRYERSFRKLSNKHKALLSHLPLKYERLRRVLFIRFVTGPFLLRTLHETNGEDTHTHTRVAQLFTLWCTSVNSFFIMNMLQAFDPPFDMSQDINLDVHGDIENLHDGHLCVQSSHCTEAYSAYPKLHVPESRTDVSGPEISSCSGGFDQTSTSLKGSNEKQEISSESSSSHIMNDNSSDRDIELIDGSRNVKVTSRPDSSPLGSMPNGDRCSAASDWMETSLKLSVPFVDVDKVRCIIRNIVRDWALEGQKERDQCYKPILEELNRLFPLRCKESPPCCLVPGAGLGRLALEISCLGFVSQGNEFSYYMMICSSFILNQTEAVNQWTIYPWIHSNSNSLSDDDQFRPVSFPDIQPASAGITEGFSMCGGDFVEVYNDVDQEASWDAVVTCFFLDTAHNIVEYIEVISKVLKDGGVWINMGPLLYHFADSYGPEEEMSIEVSLEDIKKVAGHYGFELEMEKMIETTYTANPRSMMQNHYFTAFWTMKKKPKA